jgi:carbamoyl-phosphate synthase small subunit
MRAVLLLQDGTALHGEGFGARAISQGELVFNTSMTGYQEALTDPSYAGQILLMTNPLIGNYGINKKDFESDKVRPRGFVVRSLSPDFCHAEATEGVDAFLERYGVPGITGIDTRFLVRKIRTKGVMPALLATYEGNFDLKKLKVDFDYSGKDFVREVTTKQTKKFTNESAKPGPGANSKRVVLIDYGVKMGIVRELVARGCEVIVVPSFATIEEIRSHKPDGILLSNGPGDPAILTEAHATIRALAKNYPIFGICLGHQLLAHAFRGSTYKLKFGHRGANHPVLDRKTNRVSITTQNHGYAVNAEHAPDGFEITHVNLNDSTVEGMEHRELPVFSVQYHPEASPGPHDSKPLFDRFVKMMEAR